MKVHPGGLCEIVVDGRLLSVAPVEPLPAPGGFQVVVRAPGGDPHPDGIGIEQVLAALESGTVPLDSPPGRIVLALPPYDPAREPPPDYGLRQAEAVVAYAEILAARVGGTVEAPDPQRWSDAALHLPPGAVA